jgi:hypothetical protein
MADDLQQPDTDEPGITAYHGSPHEFEQFDMSKIGTGEGQAYGHGLYFSSNENLAKGYRPESLENKPVPIVVDGKRFEEPTVMQRLVAQHRGDVDAVHKAMAPNWERAASEFSALPNDPDDLEYMLAQDEHQQALAQKAELEEMRGKKVEHDYSGHHQGKSLAGRTYEVHINAHPEHFLDWNLPLHEQSYVMQKLIDAKALKPDGDLSFMYNETPRHGGDMYERLTSPLASRLTGGETQKHASDFLNSIGIKGIRYNDGGNKSPMEKGISNYVVFDDKLVNVKRKYARGGSVVE